MVLPGRNPIVLAKELATLATMSGGRLLPAFGLGAVDPVEQQAFGVVRRSGPIFDEMLTVMRLAWTGESFSHHGDRFHYDDVRVRPAPKRMDVWLGGIAPVRAPSSRTGGRRLAAVVRHAERCRGRPCRHRSRLPPSTTGRSRTTTTACLIPYSFGPIPDQLRAVLAKRRPDLDDRSELVPTSWDELIAPINRFVDVGTTKFVVLPSSNRRAPTPGSPTSAKRPRRSSHSKPAEHHCEVLRRSRCHFQEHLFCFELLSDLVFGRIRTMFEAALNTVIDLHRQRTHRTIPPTRTRPSTCRRRDRQPSCVKANAERSTPSTDTAPSATGSTPQINCPMPEATRLRRLAIACDTTADLGDTLMNGHIGIAQADELARLATHPRVGDQYDTVAPPRLLHHAEHLSYEEFRIVTRRFETLADLDGTEHDDEMSHEHRSATVIELDGAIDVHVTGGTRMVTAELVGIFQQFLHAEFDTDVAARTALHGPDAPASLLPRTDAQRRFDAFSAIFRATGIGTCPRDRATPGPQPARRTEHLRTAHRTSTHRHRPRHRVEPRPAHRADQDHRRCHDLPRRRARCQCCRRCAPSRHRRRRCRRRRRPQATTLHRSRPGEMALLLSHSCGHPGCTVPADRCEVDHLAEWERDDGGTDQSNGLPRCSTHNPWKTANRIRSKRTESGDVIDIHADGTPMTPIGRRIPDEPDDPRTPRRIGHRHRLGTTNHPHRLLPTPPPHHPTTTPPTCSPAEAHRTPEVETSDRIGNPRGW